MKARLVSNITSTYTVFKDGVFYKCNITGKMRYLKKTLIIGDYVDFNEETLLMSDVYPRKNDLIRPKIANIDYGIVVTSIKEPDFSRYLVLKFITYLNFSGISPIIVFTKSDLTNLKSNIDLSLFLEELNLANIKYYITTNKDASSVEGLLKQIKGSTSLFFGQTGSGKSSLINLICPSFKRLIGEFSVQLNRGKHKTKETIVLPYVDNSFLVDSPGFSSLDLDMAKEEIRMNFPIISQYSNQCRYDDCTHIHEPFCKVKELVSENKISESWYNVYKELMKDEK